MHSTDLPSGITAHHNSDFSGNVLLTIRGTAPLDETYVDGPWPDGAYDVSVPFEDILYLVGRYMQDQVVSRWEETDPADVLKDIIHSAT